MREVSQNWIDNQDKTLRDQGLLRLDFLSAHNNNAKADIIPMGSDSSKSNINEIKDISPYGAPNNNLALPDLTGKEYLGGGEYLLFYGSNQQVNYNVYTGLYTSPLDFITGGAARTFPFLLDKDVYTVSVNYLNAGVVWFTTYTDGVTVGQQVGDSGEPFVFDNSEGLYNGLYITTSSANMEFTIQIEKGTQATDYKIPQPNTGYVSSRLTREDGTLTPAGSTYYGLDQPIAELNGHSLREVFEDGNVVDNHDFTKTTGWSNYNFPDANNGILRSTVMYPNTAQDNKIITGNNYYYNLSRIAIEDNDVEYNNTFLQLGGSVYNSVSNSYSGITSPDTISLNNLYINSYVEAGKRLRFQYFYVYVINRTLLGITSLTKEQMDYWFEIYQDARITPIEVNIEDYRSPLNGLTITWSENFGHAVDYSIEYNGETYTYLGNTKKTVFVPIIVENTPDANFKIRVHKWSQGGVPIRIERVFVGLHLVYKQDKIFSFNKKKYNNVLGLELPQDQINFELSNLDRMFDPLWYNSYYKYLNEKTEIRAYSGFKYGENGEEWIKQGTYYLTDWKAPNNSITATFTARDILNLLDADEMYSKDAPLTLDEYCDIILGRDYKGIDDYSPYDLPVNPDGSKKWNIRRNLAMPNLSTATDLGGGNYRLHNANGITIDYNVYSGVYVFNGTTTSYFRYNIFNVEQNTEYTLSYIAISGVLTGGGFNIVMREPVVGLQQNNENINKQITLITTTQTTIDFNAAVGRTFNNYQFKLQLEKGSQVTDYELPIENANIPVLKETVNKREALQLIAQSIGCHIKVDDNGNISFIRETYGKQMDVPKKILLTKPEFNLGNPVKKIIVPYSTYNPDPNDLEVANIEVKAGDIVEINHDTPYFDGHGTHKTGSVTIQSLDTTWFRYFKAVIGGTGTGQLIVKREPVIKSSVNVIQDISSSGDTLTYENNLIDTSLKASRAIGKIWGELDNSREVEFELRIDPRIDTFNVVSFPFNVLDLEQVEYMRVDELELTYNGAYKGKIKGVILSNYGGDLTPKTYVKRSDDFKSGEENLKWHLLSE